MGSYLSALQLYRKGSRTIYLDCIIWVVSYILVSDDNVAYKNVNDKFMSNKSPFGLLTNKEYERLEEERY